MDYIIGFIFGCIFWYMFYNIKWSKVKVDYSIEDKNDYKKNIPRKFAVYVRSSLFSKWVEYQTYADRDFAEITAKELSKNLKTPQVFLINLGGLGISLLSLLCVLAPCSPLSWLSGMPLM